jgi:hypothetical protein
MITEELTLQRDALLAARYRGDAWMLERER